MLFGENRRFLYTVNPLIEVICQLRFPAILSIDTREPAEFQETVREAFPRYSVRDERPTPPKDGAPVQTVRSYSFTSADGQWKLNLTRTFIAISAHRYTTWEDLAARLDRALASFIELYRPAFFDRVGLRYVNAVDRRAIGMPTAPWRELISAPFLGLLSSEESDGLAFTRDSLDAELAPEEGLHLRLHSGPGQVRRAGESAPASEPMFILDADFSASGNIALQDVPARLETMHEYSTRLIRAAFTDTLHEALGPEPL